MTQANHKRIYAALTALAVVGTFEGLIAILNLNQPQLFFKTGFYAGLFYIIYVALIYDLHYKDRSGFSASFSAIAARFKHLLDFKFIREWLHYLILPGLIYWGSLAVFFLNFGFPKIQQLVAVFSSAAFLVNYLYLKEIFRRGKETVDRDIFVALSVVKIYASTLVFGAALALVRSYCLSSWFLGAGIFALSFLLIYQALFQHRLINYKNLTASLLMSLAMSAISFFVLVFWGYNYFTAAVFLAACFNLMWGIFHYHLDHALTWQAFWEILVINALIAGMVFGVTNFRAKVFNACSYRFKTNK